MTDQNKTPSSKRGYGRTLQGVVTSNKADKSITVEVTRTVRHKMYNKFIKRRARYHAHDESNNANEGDTVVLVESRPLSKTKRWRLQSVVERARV